MKARKKPVEVEVEQLNARGMMRSEWFWDAVSRNEIIIYNFGKYYIEDAYCEIKTLEGVMTAKTGDYLIKGIEGEIYPCKPEFFEKTYEVVACFKHDWYYSVDKKHKSCKRCDVTKEVIE